MLHKTLLLFTALLLSGCAERGFKLTVNQTNHTVTAIKTIDTRDKKNNRTETDIKKMNTAVEKEQKKIKNPTDKIPTDTKKPVSQKKQHIDREKKALEKEKQLTEVERLKHKNKIKAQKTAQNERDTLLKKQSLEKEKQLTIAKEEKLELENKVKAEMLTQKEKAALKTKKIRQDKVRKEKDAQARKMTEEKKRYLSLTESLVFQQSRQTYQKFGTSEIHGHVVYMSPTGQEIALTHTKIYLVPKNTKIDYWYENYYLKNKEASTSVNMAVEYINATHLNIEKNFAFYGLATGIYYIIIESSYPSSIAKNKKVYIAKKINVEKYKKIMTVFSKKL